VFQFKIKTKNMEQLFNTHRLLLSNLKTTFRRDFIDSIFWNERLIGIKGARGVGKTTIVLQYIKENFAIDSEKCLYVNMDNINFTYKNILELAEKCYQNGVENLFIDEIHKQKDWIKQLKNIYDNFQTLNVRFTGSSILELDHSQADLSRRCVMYNMKGLSFREFLQIQYNIKLPIFSLSEILQNHVNIVSELITKFKPIKEISNYFRFGYFPFYLQNIETYKIKLSELINQIIEFDIPFISNIDFEHITKIKRFLYLLSQYVPVKPNISNLAASMEMSRATVSSYLHYLQKADILTTLFTEDKKFKALAKPEKILLSHPNLNFALSNNVNIGSLRETFFVNQLSFKHKIEIANKGDFLIDEKHIFEIGGKNKDYQQIADIENSYIVADDIEFGYKNKIPLWLFGFLY